MEIIDDNKYAGHLAALAANVIFGLSMPITKILLSGWMTPLGFTLTRVLFAAAVFWLTGFFIPKEKVATKDLFIIAAGGFFGFIVSQYLFATSLQHITLVYYSLITAMSPVIVMLLASLFLKEPVSGMKIAGVALGISGTALLILQMDMGRGNVTGIIMSVAANTAYAIYLIITRSVSQRYSPMVLMKWLFLFTSLMVLPFGITDLFSQPVFQPGVSYEVFGMLGYVLIGSTAIAYFLIPFALKRLRATTVSIYMNLQPIVAAIASVCIGLDTFSWEKPVAFLLVIAGAIIVTHSPSKKELKERL